MQDSHPPSSLSSLCQQALVSDSFPVVPSTVYLALAVHLPSSVSIQPVNSYPKVTHSKSKSTKNKAFFSTNHPTCLPRSDYFEIVDPTCYTEVAKIPEWCNAMFDEFSALQRQGTWSLVS